MAIPLHSFYSKLVVSATKSGNFYQKHKHQKLLTKQLSSAFQKNDVSTKTFSTNKVKIMTASETSTSLVDELLFTNPMMRVKDKPRVENLLATLVQGGLDKLQLVIDFDHTLTKVKNDKGEILDCSWGVMENSPLLSTEYTEECRAIKARYLPIEHDSKMSVQDKIPHMVAWYTEANKALQKSGVHKKDFTDMVKASNVDFRDGSNDMLTYLHDASIPVLVLSAGLGDLIVEILKSKNAYHSNLKVVSNFLAYDSEGHVTGLDGEIIHVYNKNENAIHDSDYFSILQARHNVILLGDSLGDLHMADGLENPEGVLKIGFLNTNIEERLETYMGLYDIVLMDDQTMNLPFKIIKKIGG